MAGGLQHQHYDAFVSYAHEDRAAAEWLVELLARHPVKGKDARRIFFDRHLPGVGALPDHLKQALMASTHLVVLASEHSSASAWVNAEIDEFVAHHGTDAILLCYVGAAGDDHLPAAYAARFPDLRRPHNPNLRGPWVRMPRSLQRARRENAMALLAPVAGLAGAEPLLRALRSKRNRTIAAIIALAVLGAGWLGARTAWKRTLAHIHEHMLRELATDAESQHLDDGRVYEGIRILLAEGRRREAGQLRGFFSEGPTRTMADALLAAADEPAPCTELSRMLHTVDASYLQSWPLVALTVAHRCGSIELASRARPSDQTVDGELDWAVAAVRAGDREAIWQHARSWREQITVAAEAERADWLARVQLPTTCPGDAEPTLDMAHAIERLDRAGMVSSPPAPALIALAAECLSHVEITTSVVWNDYATLAAALAAINEEPAARAYLGQLDSADQHRHRGGGDYAVGWARRALALERLGDAMASAAYARARTELFAPLEASRSWDEASDVILAFLASGRWRDAFAIADAVPDVRGRTHARLVVVERWTHEHRDTTWWGSHARMLDTLFVVR